MKKIILIDGNNLVFRSYYATAYTGNVMKNSKGFPTNALYGFISMINKIIKEEECDYMMVAFDIGKNFRVQKYEDYKAGRTQTPDELKVQLPFARKILTAMGIKYLELEPYEADDIIGTLSTSIKDKEDVTATIISSDKDLLQLINDKVEVKLLKQKDYIRYNVNNFKEDWGIDPVKIIDLKSLAGDSSDNIPGVKGVGDKTALKLLQDYDSLDGIYESIDNIKGKLKEKLIEDKDNAYKSYELATIYKEVPVDTDLESYKPIDKDLKELNEIYEELEFYSFIKKMNIEEKQVVKEYQVITNVNELVIDDICSYYIESDNSNYHNGNIMGMSITTKSISYFIPLNLISDAIKKIEGKVIYTFDQKKNIVLLNKLNIDAPKVNFDLMIAAYLLDYNLNKDDISYLINNDGVSILFYDELIKAKELELKDLENILITKSEYIFNVRDEFIKKLKLETMYDLYVDIEFPLIDVLANMELTGIKVDIDVLNEMKEEIKIKLDIISDSIYNHAGMEFNLSSPKQLGEVLFERLELPKAKKNKSGGFKTDIKILQKLVGYHPIIEKIIEHRNLNKLYTTYLEGLSEYVKDSKIHTIYRQNFTRTGRLSSTEPNLQNIPTRDEEGRKIRKAFIPENKMFLSADYSQIELRILAHISDSKELQSAFINDEDIHTKVAADIFGVEKEYVTKKMRSSAKAVIFGIVYGISGFGLSENLSITPTEAKEFIDKYYEFYPDVKKYMDNIIKQSYEEGYVTTLFNRKRNIEELKNTNYMIRQGGERIALNTPIQGTSADIIKKAMVEIYDEFKKQNIKTKMLLQVHDELIFDVYEDEKEIVTNIVKDVMENTTKLKVPLKISLDFGSNWYEAK